MFRLKEKINNLKRIYEQRKMIKDLREKNAEISEKNKQLRDEIEELGLIKYKANSYKVLIDKIKNELSTNQLGSVENFQNKLRTLLQSGKH